jgi:hypothetical protein
MYMYKLIIVLLIVTLLSGCIGSGSITGTYVQNKTIPHYAGYVEYHNQTLIIYPDSTFVLRDDGIDWGGVVKQEGDSYTFHTTLISFIEKQDKKTGNLIDEDGSMMIKVK